MPKASDKPFNLIDIGQKLVGHSKSAEFTANRGLVTEIFPFIFEASERMSARAIGRFLEEEQNIRLSAVTITKALKDPKKSWVAFFETLEPSATITAKRFRPASFKYLFLSKPDFENRIKPRGDGPISDILVSQAQAWLKPEWITAVKVLVEKWFSIGMATRLKARPHLDEYLMSLEDKF